MNLFTITGKLVRNWPDADPTLAVAQVRLLDLRLFVSTSNYAKENQHPSGRRGNI
jgi:hypothetical protein